MIPDSQFAELKRYLDREATRINDVRFIANDPVQFPRRFERLPDIEIAALLSATIAWGNRTMICNNCNKMLQLMDNAPLEFVTDGAFELLPDQLNIHRTFFGRNLKHMLRGLRTIYHKYGSLDAFAAAHHVADDETPSWRLVELVNGVLADANNGMGDSRCLPLNLRTTALKRVNMALRWLVRDDGIVDMGVWRSIPKSRLFIPLDVHVGDTARALGLIDRRANDRRTVVELTNVRLRPIRSRHRRKMSRRHRLNLATQPPALITPNVLILQRFVVSLRY